MHHENYNGRAVMASAPNPLPRPPLERDGSAVAESPFRCHICDEPSLEICPRCTRDVCDNHICTHCTQCSDCCDCEWIHR